VFCALLSEQVLVVIEDLLEEELRRGKVLRVFLNPKVLYRRLSDRIWLCQRQECGA